MVLASTRPDGAYGNAQFIVSATAGQGDYTTIAAALAAASSGQTIFIRSGTYTENPTLKAGVNLVAWDADATTQNVIINGTCTFTGAGTVSISGICLQTNSSYALTVSGSSASVVYLSNCYINCSNNTGIDFTSSSGSSAIYVNNSKANLGTTGIGLFTNSSSGILQFQNGILSNSGASTTASTVSTGLTQFIECAISFPCSTSSTGNITYLYCNVNTSSTNTTCLTTAGTGISQANYTDFGSGTASALSIGSGTQLTVSDTISVNSSNTDAITGAGTILYGLISYPGTSSVNNVTTQTTLTSEIGALEIPSLSADGVLYATSTGLISSTAVGSSGQVLTSNGSGSAPTFQAGGGAWVKLQTQTASSSASISFTSTYITSTYENYAVIMSNIVPATNAVGLNMTVSTNNGSSYLSSGYNANAGFCSSSSGNINSTNSTSAFPLVETGSNPLKNTAGIGLSGTLYLTNWTSGTTYPQVSGSGQYLESSAGVIVIGLWGGYGPTTSAINNIKFAMSSGNISTGTFTLYGITS